MKSKYYLISFLASFLLTGCSYYSNGDSLDYTSDSVVKKHEAKFERDIQKIFSEIDRNKEKIKTVEEKETLSSSSFEKADTTGSESFFRQNVLQRFKNAN